MTDREHGGVAPRGQMLLPIPRMAAGWIKQPTQDHEWRPGDDEEAE